MIASYKSRGLRKQSLEEREEAACWYNYSLLVPDLFPVTDLIWTKDTRTFWARNNRYTLHCEASKSSTPVLTGSGMSLLYSNSSGVFSPVTDLI